MPQSEGLPVWVLADDRTGDVAQCLGVAEALGWPFAVKTIGYEPLGVLHNLLRGPTLMGITRASRDGLAPPWPRLVIACGRRTAPIARWITRRSGCFVAQIMDPGAGGRSGIDLFAVPSHDGTRLPDGKVVRILGAPHRVTPERLAAETARWRPRFAHLPRPWLAVAVGGATRRREFPPRLAVRLGQQVSALAGGAGGSVLLTTSRRTGRAAERLLLSAIEPPRHVHRWGQGGDNPFMAMIGLADAMVVTGDFTSMCTEATLCRGPVFLWSPPGWVVEKHVRLHHQLFDGGYARPFDGESRLDGRGHPALNPAAEIAAAIPGAAAMSRLLLLLLLLLPAAARAAEERLMVPAAEYPWSAVGRVNYGHGWCSGVLVGPKLAVTAAHCLWNQASGRPMLPGALHFIAGWDRGDFLAASVVAGVVLAPGWHFAGMAHYDAAQAADDWALLELERPVGDEVGWVAPGDPVAAGTTVFAVGYGMDRKHAPTAHIGCHLLGQQASGLWLHGCDALHGDSGGPLMVWAKDGPRLVALHVAALGFPGGRTVGGAVGIAAFRAAALAHGAATVSRAGPLAKPLDPAMAARLAGN